MSEHAWILRKKKKRTICRLNSVETWDRVSRYLSSHDSGRSCPNLTSSPYPSGRRMAHRFRGPDREEEESLCLLRASLICGRRQRWLDLDLTRKRTTLIATVLPWQASKFYEVLKVFSYRIGINKRSETHCCTSPTKLLSDQGNSLAHLDNDASRRQHRKRCGPDDWETSTTLEATLVQRHHKVPFARYEPKHQNRS